MPMGRGEPTVVSTDPLILVYEDFANAAEVATLLRMSKIVDARPASTLELKGDWSPSEQQLLEDLEQSIGQIVGCAPHEEEGTLLIKRTRREQPSRRQHLSRASNADASRGLGAGYHVDTNGDQVRRFASALLYLSSPTGGGQTSFPLATIASANVVAATTESHPLRSAALSASRVLIRRQTYHTGNSRLHAARQVEALTPSAPSVHTPPVGAAFAATEHGVAIRPIAGNLLVFWTRDPSGICERSWHGGESVPHDSPCDKWLIRSFKEIPVAIFDDSDERARFVADSRRAHLREAAVRALLPLAEPGVLTAREAQQPTSQPAAVTRKRSRPG
jgi:hypothetical protein